MVLMLVEFLLFDYLNYFDEVEEVCSPHGRG
jgi:hypothetical protein